MFEYWKTKTHKYCAQLRCSVRDKRLGMPVPGDPTVTQWLPNYLDKLGQGFDEVGVAGFVGADDARDFHALAVLRVVGI